MHHIHHTEGIILGSRGYGEAGKYYHIFTRDLGMVMASAQGVRKMSSKLRFILQDLAYIKVDLVRGKDFWRVTSASKMNALENLPKERNIFAAALNIARLLRRLLPGEEANLSLFQDIINGFSILEKGGSKEDLENTEAILVLRILFHLGYIGHSDNLNNLIKSPFEHVLVLEAAKERSKIVLAINQALRETQL